MGAPWVQSTLSRSQSPPQAPFFSQKSITPSHRLCCVCCRGRGRATRAMSDETDDVQLPVPSRTSGAYASGVGRGSTARGGGLVGGRSSRKVVEGLRTASSRRLNYSSFTSNGSNKGMMGDTTDGSATGGVGGGGRGGTGGGGKACTACGIQFTWRMRRHHCRGCKQVQGNLIFDVRSALLDFSPITTVGLLGCGSQDAARKASGAV